jgi:hypothetical protein
MVWKNIDGCTILIILSSYHEIERHKGYMDFRELIGLNREWHIRSGQERERDCSWIIHTGETK